MIITDSQKQFLIDNYNNMSVVKLHGLFNEKFGTEKTLRWVYYICNELGLRKHKVHKYSKEEDDFLRANSEKYRGPELLQIFNEKFGAELNLQTLYVHCSKNLKISIGPDDGKYKKGGKPWDRVEGGREAYISLLKKGQSENWQRTVFKKGHESHNKKELLTEVKRARKNKDGYEVRIKTEDGWVLKQNYIWEKENGPIPEGHLLVFADGDRLNFDISNLRCVSNRTFSRLVHNKWLDNGNSDLVDTAIVYSDLMNELYPARQN